MTDKEIAEDAHKIVEIVVDWTQRIPQDRWYYTLESDLKSRASLILDDIKEIFTEKTWEYLIEASEVLTDNFGLRFVLEKNYQYQIYWNKELIFDVSGYAKIP